ncbi:MAG: hypothetical protein HC897_04315 [Thermoanaerobaculia bacterium]|nr:hypothetical protein [Thermoanaerobaculia bacterium]
MSTTNGKPVISGPIAAHFLGTFDWYDDDRMINPTDGIIARCDFGKVDMLLVSWCNALGGHVSYGDNPNHDPRVVQSIYRQIVETARRKNPNIIILIASNFGGDGVVTIAGATKDTASTFAADLEKMVRDNDFDGFCLDYESDPADETRMTNFAEAIVKAMPDKLLGISPAPTNGLTTGNVGLFDYVLPQTYDHKGFTNWVLGDALEAVIGKDRVLLGRNIEGEPDPIGGTIRGVDPLADGYGGVFEWRVDQDTRTGPGDTPTFQLLPELWKWVHPGK